MNYLISRIQKFNRNKKPNVRNTVRSEIIVGAIFSANVVNFKYKLFLGYNLTNTSVLNCSLALNH